MPVDEFDSTAVTDEMPSVEAGRVRSDRGVFSGQARPVVLSGLDVALIDGADDPSAFREWFRAGDRGGVEGTGGGPVIGPDGQPLALPDERRLSLASLIAHVVVVVILSVPAMLIVAVGIAVAAR